VNTTVTRIHHSGNAIKASDDAIFADLLARNKRLRCLYQNVLL
jgi:hypothetical protein